MNNFLKLPSQTFLKECFYYDEETGNLTWLHRPRHHFKTDKVYNWWNGRFEGKVINNVCPSGYLDVVLYQKNYKAHRIIWKLVTGNDPIGEIDHINQNRSDNSWNNLRESDRCQNQQNKFTYKNNKTGVKGVRYDSKKDRYIAEIQAFNVTKYVGQFKTLEDAERHIAMYRDKFHEEFSNYGDKATILKDTFLEIDILNDLYKHGSKTKIRGVTLHQDNPTKPYVARATLNGVRTYLGCFATMNAAKQAIFDFENSGIAEEKSIFTDDTKSGIKGITINKGNYIVRVTEDKKRIYVGTYKTKELALEALTNRLTNGS
jgi:hypothetical protein